MVYKGKSITKKNDLVAPHHLIAKSSTPFREAAVTLHGAEVMLRSQSTVCHGDTACQGDTAIPVDADLWKYGTK